MDIGNLKPGIIKVASTREIDQNDLLLGIGELMGDIDKYRGHLPWLKIGNGKHKFSELPYEPLPIPNIMDIKSYTNTGTSISYIDFNDNVFVLVYDDHRNLIQYKANDYSEVRKYDDSNNLISRISNLCDDNMIIGGINVCMESADRWRRTEI